MRHQLILRAALLILAAAISFSYGCAGTMQAIENRNMTLTAKMSETIFLDPDTVSTHRKVFVRVTNTSDFQDIAFADILKAKLEAKGFAVEQTTADAYTIQANLLYMGQESQSMTADGMLAGGFGGALLGSTIGTGWRANAAGGAAGAVVGGLVGGLIASAIHVDTFFGTVDIQIKEPSGNRVSGTVTTQAGQGSATTVTTQSAIASDKQEYRTRIVVRARQTNIDRQAAASAIADRLSTQIAGLF